MATCKNCGKKYSVWLVTSESLGTGLCNECATEHLQRVKAEERQKAEAGIRSALPPLLKGYVPDEALTLVGVAYWDTAGSALGTAIDFVVLGPLGGRQHRVGVLVVSGTDLYIVDLGNIYSEDITSTKVLGACTGPPSVKSAPLHSLKADCLNTSDTAILHIKGALTLKATFPNAYESSSPDRAAEIAKAIRAAND